MEDEKIRDIKLEKELVELKIKQVELDNLIKSSAEKPFYEKYRDVINIFWGFVFTTLLGSMITFIIDANKSLDEETQAKIKEYNEVLFQFNSFAVNRYWASQNIYAAMQAGLSKDTVNKRWFQYKIYQDKFSMNSEPIRSRFEIDFGKDSLEKYYVPIIHSLLLNHSQIYYLKNSYLNTMPPGEFFRDKYVASLTSADSIYFKNQTATSSFQQKMSIYAQCKTTTDAEFGKFNDMILKAIKELIESKNKKYNKILDTGGGLILALVLSTMVLIIINKRKAKNRALNTQDPGS